MRNLINLKYLGNDRLGGCRETNFICLELGEVDVEHVASSFDFNETKGSFGCKRGFLIVALRSEFNNNTTSSDDYDEGGWLLCRRGICLLCPHRFEHCVRPGRLFVISRTVDLSRVCGNNGRYNNSSNQVRVYRSAVRCRTARL